MANAIEGRKADPYPYYCHLPPLSIKTKIENVKILYCRLLRHKYACARGHRPRMLHHCSRLKRIWLVPLGFAKFPEISGIR